MVSVPVVYHHFSSLVQTIEFYNDLAIWYSESRIRALRYYAALVARRE
jgi:hypothetical protein